MSTEQENYELTLEVERLRNALKSVDQARQEACTQAAKGRGMIRRALAAIHNAKNAALEQIDMLDTCRDELETHLRKMLEPYKTGPGGHDD